MEPQKSVNKADITRNLDTFTRSYLVAALWSSSGDSDEFLDEDYSLADFSIGFLQRAVADCAAFQSAVGETIKYRESSAGQDFWLTRNGHGAGFWDGDWEDDGDFLTAECKKYKRIYLDVGDDGQIYG